MFVKELLVILFLLGLILCKTNFDEEYPGVKICESEMTEDFNLHDATNRFNNFNDLILKNCTHLQGSLFIRGLVGKSILFDSLKEIDGHLIIDNNDAVEISMKNLVAIRGNKVKSHVLVKSNQNVNITLQVTNNKLLTTLIISNLRSIDKHDVLIDNNPYLRYVPHKIKWNELFSNPNIQKIHSSSISKDYVSNDTCHGTCRIWTNNSASFCWGPLANQCQQKSLCEALASQCQRCFYINGAEINCCHSECIGGCYNNLPEDCVACRQMLKRKKCVASCTNPFIASGSKQNKENQFFSGSFCSSKCPDYMLPEDSTCVHHCSDGYYKNKANQCVACDGNICKKEDIPCDMVKMGMKSEKYFVLKKILLTKLTNCTKLVGYINIKKASFESFNVTVEMLYEHLSNLEELEGGFQYIQDQHLTNLTFLAKLKSFRAANIKNFESTTAYNRFAIYETNLKFLGLKSLKKVDGRFIIGKNIYMSYLNLPWKEIVNGKFLIIPKIIPGDTCDKECSDKGCWFRGNKWCYECRNFKANGSCISNCSLEDGYFLSNPLQLNGSCDKCNNECSKTCNGITSADCIGGCVHKEENGTCVKSCSHMSFEEKGTNKCLPCNKDCYMIVDSKQCSGPSNKPGFGGCHKCNNILINRTSGQFPKEEIVNCVLQCPERTFSRLTNNQEIIKFFNSNGYVCEPCHALCKECSGRRVHKDDCLKCEGYWNKDMCKKDCSKDSNYGFVWKNSSKFCLPCHNLCDGGCTGPTEYDCNRCKFKKLHFNGTKFYCLKSCPDNKKYEDINTITGEAVCNAFWESRSKKDEWKRTKITISMILIMVVIIIVVIPIIVICLRKKASAERLNADLKARYSNLTEPNSKDENAFSQPPNMGRLVIISNEDLMFEDETKPLGFGAFGSVYKGKWRVPRDENQIIRKTTGDFFLPVAIKVIKSIGNSEIDAIMQEAKIMASVSHMHCLRFIGISLSYENPCLVTAYVKEGSLDKFLSRNKPKITSLIMLSWAEQIADGMLYLTKRGIIHRDLAARNVLVSRLEFVQITDFGLSKMLESTNEREIIIKIGKVPFRWLAIETLFEGKYSFETDVWAYGVTLWEIFTFGKVPYEDQATHDISDFVMKGGRLSQPTICSLDVYMVMVNCWLESPNLRPDFQVLMKTFMDYCKNPGRYLSILGDPFEIPSPSNIEMNSFNNYYGDALKFSPGTAETMLPLLSDQESVDGVITDFKFSMNTLPRKEDVSENLLSSSDQSDLPTRTENKTSNIFRRFHEKHQPNNSLSNPLINNTMRSVLLASSEEPPFKLNSNDDQRYVTQETDKDIKYRPISQNPRMQLSQTPRFHSNPYLKKSDEFPNNLPQTTESPNHNDSTDGYLEPILNSKISHVSNISNDIDDYLEPVFTTNKMLTDKAELIKSSSKNSHKDSLPGKNSYNPSTSGHSSKTLSNHKKNGPSKEYIPQNMVDNEYLEPISMKPLNKS